MKPFQPEGESCEDLKLVCNDPVGLYKDKKKMPEYPRGSGKEASGKWNKSQCEALSLPTSALSLKGWKNTKSIKKNHY